MIKRQGVSEPSDRSDGEARIEILANLSITLDRLAAVFLVLSAVTLLVALWPTLMGLWPVLAVALVHLAIVGWCFRLAWRGNWARETIRIGPERTVVDQYALNRRASSQWPTPWLRVEVEECGGQPRVFVGSHRRRVELGRFVPAGERLEAARLLRQELKAFSALDDQAGFHKRVLR